ncbi:hypothetical protein [Flavobacterium microcysteis]
MKRFFLMGLGAMLALSCSSDDDSDTLSNAAIEGTWKLTKYELPSSFDLNNDGTASNNLLTEVSCTSNSSLVFNAGSTVNFNFSEIYIDLEPVAGTETYVYTTECDTFGNEAYPYTVSDNIVSIFGGELSLIRSGRKLIFTFPLRVPIRENGEITNEYLIAYAEFTKQ